jgi:membrane protein implicated in regulation of membrane protease activity
MHWQQQHKGGRMDWSLSTWWWIATGVLVAAELATGTFYLLMLTIGTVAAALVGWAGFGWNAQLAPTALAGGGAVALLYWQRRRSPSALPAQANRDVNLDIGEKVRVEGWNTDGTTQVSYRGAMWAAQYMGSDAPTPGVHIIGAIEGNRLQLQRSA